jgi:CheY-like chemotaxis protein
MIPGHRATVSTTRRRVSILDRFGMLRASDIQMMGMARRTWKAEGASLPYRPRFLVLDDCPMNQLAVSALLWRWGITPLVAADGAEAFALACVNTFDLILMDLQMPMLTATKQLRRFELENARPRACVVAHTSAYIHGNEAMLKACGIDATLDKTCSTQSLEQCLASWWGHDLQVLV